LHRLAVGIELIFLLRPSRDKARAGIHWGIIGGEVKRCISFF
jgi:hypothetical protein